MKKILFSFSLLLIYFCCLNVSAIDACTTSEMTRLRELANMLLLTIIIKLNMKVKKTKNYGCHIVLRF